MRNVSVKSVAGATTDLLIVELDHKSSVIMVNTVGYPVRFIDVRLNW